jgi:hypothetical protein
MPMKVESRHSVDDLFSQHPLVRKSQASKAIQTIAVKDDTTLPRGDPSYSHLLRSSEAIAPMLAQNVESPHFQETFATARTKVVVLYQANEHPVINGVKRLRNLGGASAESSAG